MKRYIIRLCDGSERIVVAKSYRVDDVQQTYAFVGADDLNDQFVAVTSVEGILLD